MNRIYIERIKNTILFVLIIGSIVQVGILWNYQNHGLPFNILPAFLFKIDSYPAGDIESIKNEIFIPHRIILSEIYDSSHWFVDIKSDTGKRLWMDAKLYLKDILAGSGMAKKPGVLPAETWGEMTASKPFVIEFSARIPVPVLAELLDISNVSAGDLSGVSKMIISPMEDVNSDLNTIYLLDDSRILSYTLPIHGEGLNRSEYQNIIASFKMNADLTNYSIISELFPATKGDGKSKPIFRINQDVAVIVKGIKDLAFNNFICSIPQSLSPDNPANINELTARILGSEKDNYDRPDRDDYGALVYKNTNNIYRLYKDGLLEYKYLVDPPDSDRGSVREAFAKALKFVNNRKYLTAGENLTISSVKESEDKKSYIFTFDYIINENPILINNYASPGREKKMLNAAITIRANGRRVLDCWWVIRKLVKTNDISKYNLFYENIADYIADIYSEQKISSDFYVKDIYMSYVIKSDNLNREEEPVLVIKVQDDKSDTGCYYIRMRKE